MRYDNAVFINKRKISIASTCYFIADIASNHDGQLSRAKELIWLAKQAGADAVKFQHFKAEKIVSDFGFRSLGTQVGHQANWKKSVYEIYKECECNREWNEELAFTAKQAGIDFMTTPYDLEAVEKINRFIPAYKIGSGDITWIDFIEYIAQKEKPVLLATGASTMNDVERAVEAILRHNRQIILMQCNTNYTGSNENFQYINLLVLKTFALRYPNMILGLSDHSHGYASVLGSITLGARVIEKHFTDDNNRIGPDHSFSMTPHTWKEMVMRSKELQLSLGTGIKQIEKNELDTVIVQRRCLRLSRDLKAGDKISKADLEALRPAPEGSIEPYYQNEILGKILKVDKVAGDALYFNELEEDKC